VRICGGSSSGATLPPSRSPALPLSRSPGELGELGAKERRGKMKTACTFRQTHWGIRRGHSSALFCPRQPPRRGGDLVKARWKNAAQARRGEAARCKARQGKARQGKARQGKARQGGVADFCGGSGGLGFRSALSV
jgi:hypothetical protein